MTPDPATPFGHPVRKDAAMKLIARLAADAPRHAVEDAFALAALCLLVGFAFAATALV